MLLLVPVWAGYARWFATATAARFLGALLRLPAAVPVAAALACGRSRLARLAGLAFVVAALAPPQTAQLSLVAGAPVAALRRGITPPPVVETTTFVTNSGLQLNVPVAGDQAWAAPIPSTPYPDPGLRPRCPETLTCGFANDRAR